MVKLTLKLAPWEAAKPLSARKVQTPDPVGALPTEMEAL
jgi:hypothetical protein